MVVLEQPTVFLCTPVAYLQYAAVASVDGNLGKPIRLNSGDSGEKEAIPNNP